MSDIGIKFERLFTKIFGGKRQKGSGTLWYQRLDVEGKSLLISLKATSHGSYRITKHDIDEAFEATKGPGGIGGDYIPLIVIDFVENNEPNSSDRMLAVINMHDLVYLLHEERELFLESKSKAKHRKAIIPSLFRQNE